MSLSFSMRSRVLEVKKPSAVFARQGWSIFGRRTCFFSVLFSTEETQLAHVSSFKNKVVSVLIPRNGVSWRRASGVILIFIFFKSELGEKFHLFCE